MEKLIEKIELDESGRVIVTDPELLALVNGAQGSAEMLSSNLLNGSCTNSACR